MIYLHKHKNCLGRSLATGHLVTEASSSHFVLTVFYRNFMY